MKRSSRVTRATVLCAASAIVLASQAAAPASPIPYPNELWVMNSDGTGQRQLTPEMSYELAPSGTPSWSPDGQEIAVAAGGDLRIFAPDGSGSRELVDGGVRDVDWSPDGALIAFSRYQPLGIYVVRPDGSGLTLVSTPGENAINPAWSPTGDEIAYLTLFGPGQPVHVRTVAPTGGVQRTLATDAGFARPAWSPDGSRLAYISDEQAVRIVEPDRSISTVPGIPGSALSLDWSPGGTKLAVATTEGIVAINPDGSGRIDLSPDGYQPAWSPDGSRLAFATDDIFTVNADGAGRTNLTNTSDRSDETPAWSPDGAQIAFISRRRSDPPPDQYYERRVSLSLSGHLVFSGELRPRRNNPCMTFDQGRTVVIQRHTARGWRRVARATVDRRGNYSLAGRDRAGQYRAIARRFEMPSVYGNRIVCERAVSPWRRHRH